MKVVVIHSTKCNKNYKRRFGYRPFIKYVVKYVYHAVPKKTARNARGLGVARVSKRGYNASEDARRN